MSGPGDRMTWRSRWVFPGQPQHPDVLAAQARVAERVRAAGGKLHSDLMAAIELRHLIVDGAQRFLADNA